MDSTIEPQAGQKGASTIHQPLSWESVKISEAGPEPHWGHFKMDPYCRLSLVQVCTKGKL